MTYHVDIKSNTKIDYTVESATDYYPYGKALRSYGKERYQSTYHERDVESGFDYRGARFYDSDIARFNSLDPLAVEFPEWSDYNYVLGNPIKFTDPDGRWPIETLWDAVNVVVDVGRGIYHEIRGDRKAANQAWTDLAADGGALLIPYVPAGATKLRYADEAADMIKVSDGYADDVVKKASKESSDAHKAAKADIAKETNMPATDKIYERPNNATTKAQRKSVQGKPCSTCGATGQKNVADHKYELVKEHYETGTIDTKRMRDINSVKPQCLSCSSKQGAEMSKYSKEMKKKIQDNN